MKKPTLKEILSEQLRMWKDGIIKNDTGEIRVIDQDNDFLAEGLLILLEPYLKKTSSKQAVYIPADLVDAFKKLWPKEKLDTGKHGRCSHSELVTAFTWFLTVHPTFNDWKIIMDAGAAYCNEREQDNWKFTRRSKYFIRKQMPDKSWTSDLSEYYERIRDGVQDESVEKFSFQPKIY